MKAIEFKRIFAMAQNAQNLSEEEQYQSYVALGGIAFETQRRIATARQCASWLRYHCLQLNGEWDMEELTNHRYYFQKVDLLD